MSSSDEDIEFMYSPSEFNKILKELKQLKLETKNYQLKIKVSFCI